LRGVFRRLLAATSEQDDGLRDLVAAVVRLHHVLEESTARRSERRGPGVSQSAEPRSLQEDCSRLMALIRAADDRSRGAAYQRTPLAVPAIG